MLYLIFALILSTQVVYADTNEHLAKWTQFRLTELFTINSSTDVDQQDKYFSDEAWTEFKQSLTDSNMLTIIQEGDYQVTLTRFIKPVQISNGKEASQHYAQSTFLIKFSNPSSSWVQPIEMILTLDKVDSATKIIQFEGIASKPIQVKNFAQDHVKQCKA